MLMAGVHATGLAHVINLGTRCSASWELILYYNLMKKRWWWSKRRKAYYDQAQSVKNWTAYRNANPGTKRSIQATLGRGYRY